jgi:hypothetical protein
MSVATKDSQQGRVETTRKGVNPKPAKPSPPPRRPKPAASRPA